MYTRNGEWHRNEAGGRERWQEEEGNGNARKGFLGFLRGRSGVRLERVGPTVEREVGGEQLCLEVAPSILIDFICAHVSESERHAARWTERNSPGGRGRRWGRRLLSRENASASGVAGKRARKKERKWGGGKEDGWMDGWSAAKRRKEKGGKERKGNNGKREEEETKSESKEREYGRTTTATTDGDGA